MILKYKQFLKDLPKNEISSYIMHVSNLLNDQVEMHQVLGYYNIRSVGLINESQIPCLLPSHGGGDNHLSARYYKESQYGHSRVHCFKCDKTLSAFWYYYAIQKDADIYSLNILLDFIREFKVEIKDEFFQWEKEIEEKDTLKSNEKSLKENIEYYQNLKKTNFDKFKKELYEIINKQ